PRFGRPVRRHDEGNLRMNATTHDPHVTGASFASAHRTHVFRQLLKREFWEHKGGFFWAPMVAGAIFLLLALMGIGVGEAFRSRISGDAEVTIEGGKFSIAGLDLGRITDHMSPSELADLGRGVDAALFMAASWPLIVLA